MSARAEIRTVTFDVGGTLIKPWPSVGHVYAEVAARHGFKTDPAILNQRFSKAWQSRKTFNHTRPEWQAVMVETFADSLDAPPPENLLTDMYEYFSEPQTWQIFPDAVPAIDELASRGINLGVISNWDERLLPLLHKLDLAKYFEAIIVSCDVGFPKPSPVIFEQAARKLGEAPEFILHVGDNLEQDAEGAAAAGYQARWLDRGAGEKLAGRITTLAELAEL
jgi:putative hydrolase of the HAD superfamily